jgi:hypothetical protein
MVGVKYSLVPLLFIVGVIVGGHFLGGCTSLATLPADRQQLFLFGVEHLQKDHPLTSSRAIWSYLNQGDEEDPRYDRGLRILARNAEKLNLQYLASMWYLDIAQGRRDPTLIPEAVAGLKRQIESGVYDEERLVRRFLAVEELPKLGGELDAFIDYLQGVHNLRQGLDEWATKRFEHIHPQSPYLLQAEYIQGVRLVALGQTKKAKARFEKLLKTIATQEKVQEAIQQDVPQSQTNLKYQVMTSLARLAMHRKDADEALTYFEKVRAQVPSQPELLLEMAWAHYYKGDPRKTLGYLLALDAPAYTNFIAPERYILEALTLRNLCQFGPARQAAVRLKIQYQKAFDDLYQGRPPEESKAVRQAASLRGELKPISLFLKQLDYEKARLKSFSKQLGPEITQAWLSLYEQGKQLAEMRQEGVLRQEVDRLAQELLSAEEAVRLISHELGIALLRGRKPPPNRGPIKPVGEIAQENQVMYKMKGEFWTDELDDFVVAAEDRCIEQ